MHGEQYDFLSPHSPEVWRAWDGVESTLSRGAGISGCDVRYEYPTIIISFDLAKGSEAAMIAPSIPHHEEVLMLRRISCYLSWPN